MKLATLALSTSVLLVACGDSSGEGGAGGEVATGSTAASGATKSASAATSGSTSATSGSASGSTNAATTAVSSSATGNPQLTQVGNVPDYDECLPTAVQGIAPVLPNEAGHYAATRLTPPSYPFTVKQVEYDLVIPAAIVQCNDMSLPHEVLVWVGGAPPAATPESPVVIPVPAGPSGTHTVTLTLPQDIVLDSGESLFVAVKLAAQGSKSLCIGSCGETAAVSDVDYWSNAPMAPYAWADMVDDFGFTNNFMTRMFGTTP